jgi:chemotaxis protein methyltransferase CheR
MKPEVFELFRELIYERSGIALGDSKVALLTARIGRRMRGLQMNDPLVYFRRIMADTSGEELTCLLDAISTNVTGFFREPAHFELLGELFEKWQRNDQTHFRMWSAACSTGEEPYSMAMVLSERSLRPGIDLRILATDINTQVLNVAARGTYRARSVDALSQSRQRRFFHRCRTGGDYEYEISEELRKMTLFKRLNLMQQPFPMKGPLDVIFCRNVMIYFDAETRQSLVAEMERLLKPGGHLFVGHAESMTGRQGRFEPVQPAVYRKKI